MHSRRRIPAERERARHPKRRPYDSDSDGGSETPFANLDGLSDTISSNKSEILVGRNGNVAEVITVTVVVQESPPPPIMLVTPTSLSSGTSSLSSTSSVLVQSTATSSLPTSIATSSAATASSTTSSSTTTPTSPTFTASSDATEPSSGSGLSSTNSGAKTSSTSKTPIAAIGVVVAIISLIIIGTIAFVMRKRSINKRQQRRATWGAGLFPSMAQKPRVDTSDLPTSNTPGPSPFPVSGYSQPSHNPSVSATSLISPPPLSYNNPASPAAYSPHPASLAPGNGDLRSMYGPFSNAASVRYAFIPSLPDELSITTGDVVKVLAEYDDGWALCANTLGEKGMVPLECLERIGAGSPIQSAGQGDWRSQKRASSLVGVGIGSSSGRY